MLAIQMMVVVKIVLVLIIRIRCAGIHVGMSGAYPRVRDPSHAASPPTDYSAGDYRQLTEWLNSE